MEGKVVIESVSFQDIDLPETIYKYRIWSNSDHKRILTQNEIHFAKPLDLSSNTEFVFERNGNKISNEELYDFYYREFKNDGRFNEDECKVYAKDWTENSPLRDNEYVKLCNEGFRQKLNRVYSIFSVSKHPNIARMWNDFAANNYGFVVGFDSKKIAAADSVFSSGGHVNYYPKDKVPFIRPFNSDLMESVIDMMTVAYSLPDSLSHEDEYRICRNFRMTQTISVPLQAYKEVILGAYMSKEDREEIIKLVTARFKGCKILQANIDSDGTYTFEPIVE